MMQFGVGNAVVMRRAQVYGARGGGVVYDWYISPTGSDATGNGTLALPYLTLTKAIAMASAGQSIGVMDGAYYQQGITCNKQLTIKKVSGAPVFHPGTAYTSWSKTVGQTNVYEATYTAAALYGAWNGTQVLASTASIAACDALTNSYYFDNPNNKLYVNIGGGAPTSIDATSIWNVPIINLTAASAVVDGLTFSYSSQAGIGMAAATQTVQNCTFSHWVPPFALQSPVKVTSTGGTVSACTISITDYPENPVYMTTGSGTCTVTGCTITAKREIDVAVGSGHIIQNTTIGGIIGAAARGIYIHGTAASVTVTGCTITAAGAVSSTGYGIHITAGTGHVITQTTVNGNGYFIDGLFASGAGITATLSYCTFYDCIHANYYASGVGTAITYHHCLAYSTHDVGQGYGWVGHGTAALTLYHCVAAYALRNTGLIRSGYYILDATTSMYARNCIAYKCGNGFHAEAGTAPDVDYCLANSNTLDYTGLSAGAHDVTGDPLFVDETAYSEDFNIQAGSPCINTGLFIAGVSETNPPDIGRYET